MGEHNPVSTTRYRFPSDERRTKNTTIADETASIVALLESQMEQEETMTTADDMEKLEDDYFANLHDPNARLRYASYLIRTSHISSKDKGIRILYDIYRDFVFGKNASKVPLDNESIRTVKYYLMMGNYRLQYYEESKRFVEMILKDEPENIQAQNFKLLLQAKTSRKIMVVLDTTRESCLAFNRALEIRREHDELLLVTIIDEEALDKLMKESGSHQLPAHESLKQSRGTDKANAILDKFLHICAERKIKHSFMFEIGEARADICEIVNQESVDVCVVPFGPLGEKGFFSRVRLSQLSEYLYHNAKCDVVVVKDV